MRRQKYFSDDSGSASRANRMECRSVFVKRTKRWRPINNRDRLQARLDAPLQPRCRQKPLAIGLWDEDARNQLELF